MKYFLCFSFRDNVELFQQVIAPYKNHSDFEVFILDVSPQPQKIWSVVQAKNVEYFRPHGRYHLSQAINYFCNLAKTKLYNHFYFCHADCIITDLSLFEDLANLAEQTREYSAISAFWTDVLIRYSTKTMSFLGGFDDTFIYSWMEIDYIYRSTLYAKPFLVLSRNHVKNKLIHVQAAIRRNNPSLQNYWKIVDHHDWLYWCKKWGENPIPYIHSTSWTNLWKIPFNTLPNYDFDRSTITD